MGWTNRVGRKYWFKLIFIGILILQYQQWANRNSLEKGRSVTRLEKEGKMSVAFWKRTRN
jgi:hypothetical protein